MVGISEQTVSIKHQSSIATINYQKVSSLISSIRGSYNQSQKTDLQNELVQDLNESGVTPQNSLLNTDNLRQIGIVFINGKFEISKTSNQVGQEPVPQNVPKATDSRAEAFHDYYLRNAVVIENLPTQQLNQEDQIKQLAKTYGHQAAEVAELGIALIPVYGASVDIKDILEQVTNMVLGKEVDNFTIYMSILGIVTELTPAIDPVVDLVKAHGKNIPPELQTKLVEVSAKAVKLGKFDQLKTLTETLGRISSYLLDSTKAKLFKSETKRLTDLCEAMFFKFPKSLLGNEKLIADNLTGTGFKSLEDFYFAIRKNPVDLTKTEKEGIVKIRNIFGKAPLPNEDMIMIKAIPVKTNKVDVTIPPETFVVKKSDLKGIKSMDELINKRLRLDYPNTNFNADNISFYKFDANDATLDIPFHKEIGETNINVKNKEYPYTGTGFISSEDRIIPEYFIVPGTSVDKYDLISAEQLLKELK